MDNGNKEGWLVDGWEIIVDKNLDNFHYTPTGEIVGWFNPVTPIPPGLFDSPISSQLARVLDNTLPAVPGNSLPGKTPTVEVSGIMDGKAGKLQN